jgi:hypothetical protein
MALPSGATYDGRPQQEQVRDAPAHAWATFPDVLAATLTQGVTVGSGPIQGVSAKVRKFDDDVDLEPAIIDSLDRGVAVALLVDGTHWVVVHQYVEHDDGTIEIYYRDGLHPKLSSETPWDEGDFTSEVTLAPGIYSGKYIAVTASATVSLLASANGRRLVRRSPKRKRTAKRAVTSRQRANGRAMISDLKIGKVQPIPDSLGPNLAERLGRDPEWGVAFAGALQRFVLTVSGTRPGNDYYLVDFSGLSAAASAASGLPPVKTAARSGSVIVDAYTLKPRVTAGIDKPGQRMPTLLAPQDVPAALERLGYHVDAPAAKPVNGRPNVRVDPTLVWSRCDQSMTPFLPFYKVYATDPNTHAQKKMYLRADGRLFDKLTQRMSGI